MAYTLEFEKAAIRALKKLPPTVEEQIKKDIRQLCEQPRPPGCIKLKSNAELWRIRSGNYRVIYDIQDAKLVILIVTSASQRHLQLISSKHETHPPLPPPSLHLALCAGHLAA